MDVLGYLMDRSRSATTMLTMLAVVSLFSGCNRPISDANKLEAIRAGAQALMKKYPAERPKNWRKISKGKWPAAIADLYPEDVTVHTWGVDITTKAYFDGGYGYDLPVSKANLPMPAACYSEPSRGVFWHGPC